MRGDLLRRDAVARVVGRPLYDQGAPVVLEQTGHVPSHRDPVVRLVRVVQHLGEDQEVGRVRRQRRDALVENRGDVLGFPARTALSAMSAVILGSMSTA